MPSLIGVTDAAGITVAANYLVVKQSPGAAYADKDGTIITTAPLLTFNTPNLQMFRVTVSGDAPDLTVGADVSNSAWSKVIRAVQVTSEVFAIFAPTATEFCFMAPDFNTNAGDVTVKGAVQEAIAQRGGNFSIVEKAITDALGAGSTAVVRRAMVVGGAVVNEVAPV